MLSCICIFYFIIPGIVGGLTWLGLWLRGMGLFGPGRRDSIIKEVGDE